MPPESPRIAELRRRVEADPSSIAFAQLAEEYRRSGNFAAAEQCCRTGLVRHPGYLSARVTLGRTLIELNKLEEAQEEFQFVLKSAPDNLAAIRGMAEIHQRRGHLESALDYYRRALPLARHDPEIEETVRQIHEDLGAAKPKEPVAGLSFKEAQDEFLAALNRLPLAPARPAPIPDPPAPSADVTEQPSTEPPASPPPATSTAVDSDIDFDSLLKSLGVPEHQPPPMVEALISETAPAAAVPETHLPEPLAQPPQEDSFSELERNLRTFDASDQESADTAPGAPSASVAPEEEAILDELEAWLAAIRR